MPAPISIARWRPRATATAGRREGGREVSLDKPDQNPARTAASPWLGSRVWRFGGAAALAFLCVLEAGLEITDSDDFWWGMAAGRVISQDLAIPSTDVFSHTFAGRPWINPEWLTHVLFYNVYTHLGENWIVVLRVVLVAAIFALALALCMARSESWTLSLLTVAAGAWVCRPFLDARPQLFTFLGSIALLYLLHLFRRRGKNLLGLIPIVMLIWTQLHGGYFFGLLVLVGNLLAESGKRLLHLPSDPLSWRRIRALGAATLASVAVMWINPWGHHAFTHPLEMSRLVSGENIFLAVTQEWLPPTPFTAEPFNPLEFWLFLVAAALAILPVAAVRWRRFDCNDVGLAAVLAVAFALQHRRFIPLFVILTLPLFARSIKLWLDLWFRDRHRRPGRWAVPFAAWLLLLCLLPLRLFDRRRDYAAALQGGDTLFRINTHQAYYPELAVRLIRDTAPGGLMFNLYNWGGYLAYFLPEHRTFIDGRAQTVFDEPFHREYLKARTGSPGWREVLERYDIGFALLHAEINAVLIDAMGSDPDWQWIFADGDSRLLVKRDDNHGLLDRFRARRLPLPETGTTYFLYARQASQEGNYEQAAADLAKACELSPANDEFHAEHILALSAAGRLAAAEKTAERAAEAFPDSGSVRLAAARVAAAAARDEDAFRRFDEVFRRWPERLQAVDGMLEIDFDRARDAIRQLHRDDPSAPWRGYAMGRVAELEGRLGDARRFYNAEGLAAEEAGDQIRMLRTQQATDRLLDPGESR